MCCLSWNTEYYISGNYAAGHSFGIPFAPHALEHDVPESLCCGRTGCEIQLYAVGRTCQIDGKNSTYPEKHLIDMRICKSNINCHKNTDKISSVSRNLSLLWLIILIRYSCQV